MFTLVGYILVTAILVIVIEFLSLIIIDFYDDYLIRQYEKQCKHICLFCKYKDRCDWYNR